MTLVGPPIIIPPGPANAAKARLNLVTFKPDGADVGYATGEAPTKRIFLKLEEPWRRKAGLEPDTNQAVCSYKEFAGIGSNADVSGQIEFWYTNAPGKGKADVTLLNERIVAVESSGQGETPDK